ncbi:MAG: hypothetical protein GY866_02025 [Proteobacteria bacterium]|nr:hypothetical protein [Pseudomonadota bacterium]
MIRRKLLVVHESNVARNLLNGFILSEFNDIVVKEAESRIEAEQLLQEQNFDIILSSIIVRGISDLPEKGVNFIALITDETPKKIRELDAHNIQHYLVTPYTPAKLRDKINDVYHSRRLRTEERYYAPGIKSVLHFNDRDLHGEVINISKDGFLCELDCHGYHLDLLGNVCISIEFPTDFDKMRLTNIECKFLNLKVLKWDSEHKPERVQIVWLFIEFEEKNRKNLQNVLETIQASRHKLSSMMNS